MDHLVTTRTVGHVRVIELARSDKRNALSTAVLTQLDAAAASAQHEWSEVRVVVVTGAGGHFSAGADIAEFSDWDPANLERFIRLGNAVFSRLSRLPQPVIAAIEGYALGGGLELALACDLRIAGDSAVVGFPEVTIGGVPGWGGTIRLQELIGRSRATRMILTGNRVSAHEALQLGLIDEQAADGSALRAALDLAAELATRSPVALRLATHAARCGSPYDADAHADVEMAANLLCMHSPDRRGAVASFLDPR